MDLGFVRFERNAHAMDFNTDALNFDNVPNTQINGTAGVDSLIYATAMNGTAIKNSFVMSLPTGLSSQFDRWLKPRWYLNSTAIQRVTMPMARVEWPNMLVATIRYESPSCEVGVASGF